MLAQAFVEAPGLQPAVVADQEPPPHRRMALEEVPQPLRLLFLSGQARLLPPRRGDGSAQRLLVPAVFQEDRGPDPLPRVARGLCNEPANDLLAVSAAGLLRKESLDVGPGEGSVFPGLFHLDPSPSLHSRLCDSLGKSS